MTRCTEFYQKWANDPNWCEKCGESARLIDNYLDLLKEFEARGIPKKATMVGLSERAARPLFLKSNEDIRNTAIDAVVESLKSQKNPLNGRFLKKWGTGDMKRFLTRLRNNARSSTPSDLPVGMFNVLYVDPPWQYDNVGVHGSAESHYPTMSVEELCSLKLPAAENAVLFLWVTNPMLEDALKLVHAWSFEYKTNIVWVKTNLEKPGVGFYVRGRHELLFICVKGSFLPDQLGKEPVGSVVSADIQEHSRKPDIFYEIIERLYPGARYLELFARRERTGWASWGNELVVAQ